MSNLMPNATGWGFVCGVSFMVAADAVHGFLSSPPGASTARTWAMAAQLVLGAAVALAAYRRGRSLEGGSDRGGRVGNTADGPAA